MKTIKNKFTIHCLLILALLASFLTGCRGTESHEQPTTPPQIPPISSFVMDFADFNSQGEVSLIPSTRAVTAQQVSFINGSSGSQSSDQYAMGTRKNWGFAALNVGFWSVVVVVGLAIPVAAFVESFDHTPEQQPDYTWIWSYDVTVNDVTYTAELHGKYIDNGVRWDMYISKQNEYTDFQWYYGESDLPATEGFWILKKNPSDPTDLLRIDWKRDLAEGTYDIKYTNIVLGGPENGGYIFHGVTTDELYDRFYEIFNKGKDNYTYIEWDSTTKEGRVKDTRHFNDSEWHCWDADYMDVDCE
jgi:hypothetical protein